MGDDKRPTGSTATGPHGSDEAVDRGFLGTLDPLIIKAADGRVVWEM